MSLVELDNISLSFSGVKALKGVSVRADEGSVTAVIGPNGAGKTSLFNCVSGVYRPQSGDIRIQGISVMGQKPHSIARMGVARMFQNLALFEHLTVLENLLIGRHHRFRSHWLSDLFWRPFSQSQEIEHRRFAEDIIDFLHLERYRLMPVGILPYGVLKRVELGRALCMEPKLLLLDEPAAGLNQEETEDMARYIMDIKEELGITQILIEHELRFVMDLADHVCVLDFGQKIAEGLPSEVYKDPEVIRAYLGSYAEEAAQ